MSFAATTLKFLIVIENHASYHTKKIGPRYAVCVVGRSPEFELAALAPFPSISINTRSTSFVVLPVARFSATTATSTPGKLKMWLLAFEEVLETDPD